MLRELHVRGLGVLDDVTVQLGPGLNVLTGETGAGKTLLVSSVQLLTGARATGRLAASDAWVEAVADAAPVTSVLAGRGLEAPDGEVILARRLARDGRSRAWLAGALVPVSALAEAGAALVQVHGQGESFALARPDVQLDALDAFAGIDGTRARFAATLARVRALRAEAATLAAEERERARAADVLSFQIDEIERARLDPAADDALAARVSRLEHAERLAQLAASAANLLGSDGASGQIGEAAAAVTGAVRLDPALAGLATRIDSLAAEAGDVASELRGYADGSEHDPAALDELRERAALVSRLQRRYGDTIDEIATFAAGARAELDALRGASDRAGEIDAELPALCGELDEHARTLSAARAAAASRLTDAVSAELPALALPHARFVVTVEPSPETACGRDRVTFSFSAVPNLEPVPIGKAASGGELSRLMIAVTLALAKAHAVPTLIFDEADQGVGGQAALELAGRLQRLGRSHQVVVVTHLPQIAAFADHHLVVSKDGVAPLEGDARVAEISRMLAGLHSSERGRAHAAELIELSRRRRRTGGKVAAEAR